MHRHCLLLATLSLTMHSLFAPPATAVETVHVALPKPRLESGVSVEEALLNRRSQRNFAAAPLTVAELGQLLWAAQGETSSKGLRAAPSAGALYPLELYVVAGSVTGLATGVYRYLPKSHTLRRVIASDRRAELSQGAWRHHSVTDAPASLVFAAVYARTTRKYGGRGVRYVHMDAAHAAENVYLQAAALDLATFVIGGFEDAAVAKAVGLPAAEEPLAIMPVGKPKRP
jgi:SagB-type dehydrogenase family enzyme